MIEPKWVSGDFIPQKFADALVEENIAGLLIEKEATVEDLHNQHPNLMCKVSNDILSLQAQLTGQTKICALGPNTGEEINTLESMPFFFSNHTEITVGSIKSCIAQSRGNNPATLGETLLDVLK
jgi:hypothetical protein